MTSPAAKNPLDDELAHANLRTAITFFVSGLIVAVTVLAYYLPLIQHGTARPWYFLAPAVLATVAMMLSDRRFEVVKDLHARFEPGGGR